MMDLTFYDDDYIDDGYYNYVADASVSCPAYYGMTAIPDVQHLAITVTMTANYGQLSKPTVNRSTTIALATIVTLNEQAAKIRHNSAGLTSNYNQTVSDNRIRGNASTQNAQFSLSTGPIINYVHGSASLNANYSQSTLNTKIKKSTVALTAVYSETIHPARTVRSSSTMNAVYSETVSANSVKTSRLYAYSTYSQSSVASRIRSTLITQSAIFTQHVLGGKIQIGAVFMNAVYTIFEKPSDLRFKYIWKIIPEVWAYKIHEETRIYKIRSDNE